MATQISNKILQEYLPANLFEKFTNTPDNLTPDETIQIIGYLNDLLKVVSMYLPNNLVQRCISNPDDNIFEGRCIDSAILFADIAGFTSLSEKLSRLGKEGAEEITKIINSYFSPLLDVIYRYKGNLLRFGGDAITVIFLDDDKLDVKKESRAVMAGWEMQKLMENFKEIETSQGKFTFGIHFGLHTGKVWEVELGSPSSSKREYWIVGRHMNKTAQLEEKSQAGEIRFSQEIYNIVKDLVEVEEVEDEAYKLLNLKVEPQEVKSSEEKLKLKGSITEKVSYLISRIESLKTYLPVGLFEKIKANPQNIELEGEHRRVTTIFLNFWGIDYDNDKSAIEKLQTYFSLVHDIVRKYDGIVNKLDIYSRGDKMMILFGVPSAHENDDERAVRCALEIASINESLSFPIKQSIGINSGYVFAGNVGSMMRKEYTVMGDAVNLSARLMSNAPEGKIIMSRSVMRKVWNKLDFEELKPIIIKGKADPISIYDVKGLRIYKQGEVENWVSESETIIGREKEIELIDSVINKALTGKGQVLSIVGDAGMGKSRLKGKLIQMWLDRGYKGFGGNCQSFGSSIFYLPWIDLMSSFFGFTAEDSLDLRKKKMEEVMVAIDPTLAKWTPVMGEMLNLKIDENDLTRSLDAKLRKQRIFDITLQLLSARAEQSPLLLVFEDLHWIDPTSMELLNYVARNIKDKSILMVMVYRPSEEKWEFQEKEYHQKIVLSEFSKEESLKLAQSLLKMEELPEEFKELVLKKSQGNPFYVEEVVKSLMDAGAIQFVNGKWQVIGDIAKAEIPDTINGVIMTRIDRLQENEKYTLQVASVIGREFEYKVLEEIYPLQKESLREHLASLHKLDLLLLEVPGGEPKYIFKHILTQEVAYESLLFSRRRELHKKIAEYYELNFQDNLEPYYELLAFHYPRSEELPRALNYAVLAGDKAKKTYANYEAIRYYDLALEVFDKMKELGYKLEDEPESNKEEVK